MSANRELTRLKILKQFKTIFLLKKLNDSRKIRKNKRGIEIAPNTARLRYRDDDGDMIEIVVSTDDLIEELNKREHVENKIERRKSRQVKAKAQKSFDRKQKKRPVV